MKKQKLSNYQKKRISNLLKNLCKWVEVNENGVEIINIPKHSWVAFTRRLREMKERKK